MKELNVNLKNAIESLKEPTQISRVPLTRVTREDSRLLARPARATRMQQVVSWPSLRLLCLTLPIWRQTPKLPAEAVQSFDSFLVESKKSKAKKSKKIEMDQADRAAAES